MLVTLAILLCLGTGTIGGVFFAFSTFIMKALANLPPAQGVAAMQRINIVVINPFFIGVFAGTALLAGGCAVVAFLPWNAPGSLLLLTSALLYLAGTFGVTIAFNVPRNEQLGRLEPDSPETATYWRTYQREWTLWNHVRAAAALAASACAAGALLFLRS